MTAVEEKAIEQDLDKEINDIIEKWVQDSLKRIFGNFPKGWVSVTTGEKF